MKKNIQCKDFNLPETTKEGIEELKRSFVKLSESIDQKVTQERIKNYYDLLLKLSSSEDFERIALYIYVFGDGLILMSSSQDPFSTSNRLFLDNIMDAIGVFSGMFRSVYKSENTQPNEPFIIMEIVNTMFRDLLEIKENHGISAINHDWGEFIKGIADWRKFWSRVFQHRHQENIQVFSNFNDEIYKYSSTKYSPKHASSYLSKVEDEILDRSDIVHPDILLNRI